MEGEVRIVERIGRVKASVNYDKLKILYNIEHLQAEALDLYDLEMAMGKATAWGISFAPCDSLCASPWACLSGMAEFAGFDWQTLF